MKLNSARMVNARPQGNFELYAWFFMRVSGIILLCIAVFHLLYMHLVVRVDKITWEVVARRWQNPGWRLFDLALLAFALAHGTNGLRTVLDDYVPRGIANVGLKWAAYAVSFFFFLMGAYAIFSFNAASAGALGQ